MPMPDIGGLKALFKKVSGILLDESNLHLTMEDNEYKDITSRDYSFIVYKKITFSVIDVHNYFIRYPDSNLMDFCIDTFSKHVGDIRESKFADSLKGFHANEMKVLQDEIDNLKKQLTDKQTTIDKQTGVIEFLKETKHV